MKKVKQIEGGLDNLYRLTYRNSDINVFKLYLMAVRYTYNLKEKIIDRISNEKKTVVFLPFTPVFHSSKSFFQLTNNFLIYSFKAELCDYILTFRFKHYCNFPKS